MNSAAFAVAQTRRIVPLLLGEPGTGKTSLVLQFAQKLGLDCVLINVAHYSAVELHGAPKVGEYMDMVPPWWAHEYKDKDVVLFFDEITNARPTHQAALLSILSERRVGRIHLTRPIIIAAGNPPDCAADPQFLSEPFINRLCVLQWALDDGRWLECMLSGAFISPEFPMLPSDWEGYIPRFMNYIGAFLTRRRELIRQRPKEPGTVSPHPTHRAWHLGAVSMAACAACQLSKLEQQAALAGHVGEHAAAEFAEWEANLDLPDPEELLSAAAHKGEFKWPSRIGRLDQAYVALTSCAGVVCERFDRKIFAAFDKLIRAAYASGFAEASVVALRTVFAKKPDARIMISDATAEAMEAVLTKAGY